MFTLKEIFQSTDDVVPRAGSGTSANETATRRRSTRRKRDTLLKQKSTILSDESGPVLVREQKPAQMSERVTNSENFAKSMLPPLTTHTIFPEPHLPLRPAATAQAPAPSLITRLRSATMRMALRVSSSVQTMDPASR